MCSMRRWGWLLIIGSLLGLGGCRRDLPIGQVVSWEKASAESRGLDGSLLEALKDDLAAKETHAFLVVRNNKIVYEWYARGHGSWRLESAASLSKSLVGGLALMVAVQEVRGLAARPSAEEVDTIGESWRPWRAVAARMLWHYYLSRRKSPDKGDM